MKLAFCRSNTFLSWAVRVVTWSEWSHIVVMDPDSPKTIEAAFPGGVFESTLEEVFSRHDEFQVQDFHCADPAKALAWARSQIGAPYAILGCLGILFHRAWRQPGSWECASFATEVLTQGGSPPFREEFVDRVSPQDLWMLAPSSPVHS